MTDPFTDAVKLADLVHRGEVTPTELVDETIARIEKVNPEFNAITIPLFEKARFEAARVSLEAPFAGVPYVVKDLSIVSDGDPCTSSIKGVKESEYRSDHDSYLVRSMREAGFVLVGRTNGPEMGMLPTAEPEAWGPTRNPWDRSRSTGGSSGGSGAAVAGGLVSVAHGNDGGGSVRIPAAICGLVGLKPSRGRISQGPLVVEADNVSGSAVEGFLTHSVRDQAALFDIVSGHRPGDAYCAPTPARPFREEVGVDPGRLRIGVLTHDPVGEIDVDPENVRGARDTADLLASLGHHVEDGFPPALTKGSMPDDYMPCAFVALLRERQRYEALIGRPMTEDDFEPMTWLMMQQANHVTGAQYAAGIDSARIRAGEIERWWTDGWDLLLTPTVAAPPAPIGLIKSTKEDPMGAFAHTVQYITFTVPYNISGQPAISLPMHWNADGLPVGVQLVAAYGREDLLIRIASQLEAARPWAHRHPAVPMA